MEYQHQPVLLDACIQGLAIQPEGVYLDGTLGRCGHSREIAKRLTTGRLFCIDRDETALEAAQSRLADVMDKVTLIHGNFQELQALLKGCNAPRLDGMLFDLGVSSPQLDDPHRGFSYMQDAPLDMRMDVGEGLTAGIVVNEWSREAIKQLLWQYGEERYAPLIAAAIEGAREQKPIETTLELVEIIKSAMPSHALREKQHPAKRSFQAIRIAVNDELTAVDGMLQDAIHWLKPKGRLCVISFHSLEDRIVKKRFAMWAKGCTCPPKFPACVCGKTPEGKLVTRKPMTATKEELEENPRARSAKLRVLEKRMAE